MGIKFSFKNVFKAKGGHRRFIFHVIIFVYKNKSKNATLHCSEEDVAYFCSFYNPLFGYTSNLNCGNRKRSFKTGCHGYKIPKEIMCVCICWGKHLWHDLTESGGASNHPPQPIFRVTYYITGINLSPSPKSHRKDSHTFFTACGSLANIIWRGVSSVKFQQVGGLFVCFL